MAQIVHPGARERFIQERSLTQIRAEVEAEYRRTGRINGERPSGNVGRAIEAEIDRRWTEQDKVRRHAQGNFTIMESLRGENPDTVAGRIRAGESGELRAQAAEDFGRFFGGVRRFFGGGEDTNPTAQASSAVRRLQEDFQGSIDAISSQSARLGGQGANADAAALSAATGLPEEEVQGLLDMLNGGGDDEPRRSGGLFGAGDDGVFIKSGREPRPVTPGVTPDTAVRNPATIGIGPDGSRTRDTGQNIPTPLFEALNTQQRALLPTVIEMAQKHGVPSALLFGLLQKESGFNTDAVNRANRNGTVDYGVAQINSSTLSGMGKTSEWAMNSRNAIDYAARRLAASVAKYGSQTAALIEYNGGAGRADEYMQTGQWPYEAAEGYVTEILEYASAFNPNQNWEVDNFKQGLGKPLETLDVQLASGEDVEQAAREIGRQVIGRYPDDDALPGIVSMIHALQRGEQGQNFRAGLLASQAAEGGGSISPMDVWDEGQIGSVASQIARHFGLSVTSHKRSPERNAAVNGAKDSDHLWGGGVDFAGPKENMDRLASWARGQTGGSGPLRIVLWQQPGHHDHVHLSWKRDTSEPLQLPGEDGATVQPQGTSGGGEFTGTVESAGSEQFVQFETQAASSIENAISDQLRDLFPEEAGAKDIMDQGEALMQIIGVSS